MWFERFVIIVVSLAGESFERFANATYFFFSGRRRHTRWNCDWSSDVCSSDLSCGVEVNLAAERFVDRATENLLRAFAAGPAGRAHPAQDNLAQVKPPRIPGLYDGVD